MKTTTSVVVSFAGPAPVVPPDAAWFQLALLVQRPVVRLFHHHVAAVAGDAVPATIAADVTATPHARRTAVKKCDAASRGIGTYPLGNSTL